MNLLIDLIFAVPLGFYLWQGFKSQVDKASKGKKHEKR